MTRNRLVAGVLVFTVGVLAGASLLAFMSSHASRLFLQMVRMSFASEEETRLAEAWRKGAMSDALAHAACGVAAERGPQAFDPVRSPWGMGFPLMGAFVTERTRYPVQDSSRVEALAHAKLAVVLERLGQAEAAQQEYAAAARLTGQTDASRWKEVALSELGRTSRSTEPR